MKRFAVAKESKPKKEASVRSPPSCKNSEFTFLYFNQYIQSQSLIFHEVSTLNSSFPGFLLTYVSLQTRHGRKPPLTFTFTPSGPFLLWTFLRNAENKDLMVDQHSTISDLRELLLLVPLAKLCLSQKGRENG